MKTWTVSCRNSEIRSVLERTQDTEREFDPLFIVSADVSIDFLHKLVE